MKITLKTVVLVFLLAFYVLIIISNFSNLEGFVASDSTTLGNTVDKEASKVVPSGTSPRKAV